MKTGPAGHPHAVLCSLLVGSGERVEPSHFFVFTFHLIEKAKEVLAAVSPELAHVESHFPDEASKWVGQWTALASLL